MPARSPATGGTGDGVGEAQALDAQLVASSRGDERSFAQLYDSVAPRIFGLVLRILRDVDQSEHVTREVFLEIWRAADRFDPQRGTALAWVMTMAHQRALQHARCSGPRPSSVAKDTTTRADATAEAIETDACAASPNARTVREALALLSPAQREAVDLAYFRGLSHSEVSDLLHLPLSTVKDRLHGGLGRLRSMLPTA